MDESSWEMPISNIFRLWDGRAAFVGTGLGVAPLLDNTPCDVVADGSILERVAVTTDFPSPRRQGLWSFTSTHAVQLDAAILADHACVLRPASE
jgi:hypothetical protein